MKEKIVSAAVRDSILDGVNSRVELQDFLNGYSFSTIMKKSIIKKLSAKSEEMKNAVSELMQIKPRKQKDKSVLTFKDVKRMFLNLCKGIPEADYNKVTKDLDTLITYASSFSEIQKISAELKRMEKDAKKAENKKKQLEEKKKELEALKQSDSSESDKEKKAKK